MLPEDVLSKITKIIQKIIDRISFGTEIVGVDPMNEEDFTPNVNNFDHYMPFLSINLFKGHTLLTLAQNTGVFTKSPKLFWRCGARKCTLYLVENIYINIYIILRECNARGFRGKEVDSIHK